MGLLKNIGRLKIKSRILIACKCELLEESCEISVEVTRSGKKCSIAKDFVRSFVRSFFFLRSSDGNP